MNNFYGFNNEKKNLIDNFKNYSLSNSIIIHGEKGIGKQTFVFNLIKEFISFSVKGSNLSHHFNLINNNSHPNIRYLCRDYDTKTNKEKKFISIDQVRKLHHFFYESSLDGLNKFIIIDSADDLNHSSANSLLKLLEEPKKNIFIFLISHQFSSILSTIRSRCLKIRFHKHDFTTFSKIITDKLEDIEDDMIKFLFDISNGSPGIALELQNYEILEFYNEILIFLVNNKSISKNQFEFSNKFSKFDNDKFKIFLSLLKFVLINLYKIKLGINLKDQYLYDNYLNLVKSSDNISQNTIFNSLEYLIINENDLFAYNLDKKLFLLNFFAQVDN